MRVWVLFWCHFIFAIGLAVLAFPAQAGSARITFAAIDATIDQQVLSADFSLVLGEKLVGALHKGVSLHFAVELEVVRGRWYWTDEQMIAKRFVYQLSFQPITEVYRVTLGNEHSDFNKLDDALDYIRHIRRLPLAPRRTLSVDESYEASLRVLLDLNALPKPLQISVLGDESWDVRSREQRWDFVPATEIRE